MKKIKFPIGTSATARLLNSPVRTIRDWCHKLGFSRIDPDNELSPFQILTIEEFNLLKSKLRRRSGNPNWVKYVK